MHSRKWSFSKNMKKKHKQTFLKSKEDIALSSVSETNPAYVFKSFESCSQSITDKK